MNKLSLVCVFTLFACSEYDLSSTSNGNQNALEEGDGVTPDGATVYENAGALKGRICSPSEATWVSEAQVWIELEDGNIVTTLTDGDGWFLLGNVPAGEHQVFVEKGSFSTNFVAAVAENQTTEMAVDECLNAEEVEIAVVTGDYDTIGVVLSNLGFEYTTFDGADSSWDASKTVDFLRDPSELEKYDIIFFNCGMTDDWVQYQSEVANNIKDYVSNGGSVYTSDWAYWLAEVSHPSMADFHGDDTRFDGNDAWEPADARVGVAGEVHATVLDSAMATALGSASAELSYDLDLWAAMEGHASGEVLIEGSYSYYTDFWNLSTATRHAPLAVRQHSGSGQILYTSFHNESQMTLDMDILLEQLILSL